MKKINRVSCCLVRKICNSSNRLLVRTRIPKILIQFVFHFRLNSVEDLMANPSLMAETKDVLKALPDLERLLKKYET